MTRFLLFSFCFLPFLAVADSGSYITPDDRFTPHCLEICRTGGIKNAYMHFSFVKKGKAAMYQQAGLRVYSGWFPYGKLWQLPPDEQKAAVKKWVSENIGDDRLPDIAGFEIDEPLLGYGDWNREVLSDLETNQSLQQLFREKFNRPLPVARQGATAADWRNVMVLRQSHYWDRLATLAATLKTLYPDKAVRVTLSPCGYESGASVGFDGNLLPARLPTDVPVMLDPYFQAFRRPLQWSGMMLRKFKVMIPDRSFTGIIQYYDAMKDSGWPYEGYVNLQPDDVDRQVFEFLMHGANDITLFLLDRRIFTGKPEYEKHLGDALRFAAASKEYWPRTAPSAQVGIYFSENTFRMHDLWGPWSRMTGAYGASFQTEWVYYSLSQLHIPANLISIPFSLKDSEKELLEKLNCYAAVILPEVKCMSPAEAAAFTRYVENGGHLIVTGETSFFNENGEPLPQPSLAALLGVNGVEKGDGKSLIFRPHRLLPGKKGFTLPCDGNAVPLFREQAARHPQWLKEKCVEKKSSVYDLKFEAKLPAPAALKLTPTTTAEVLAVYPDQRAAALVTRRGRGECIYIAPSDLLLFKGKVENSLETTPGAAGQLELLDKLVTSCLGKKWFEVKGAETVEAACRKSGNADAEYIYLLNHAAVPAENVSLKINRPPADIKAVTLLDQASGRETAGVCVPAGNESVTLALPAFRYGLIVKIALAKP
ncbi:MAG: Beta-galactosidase trimerization domain protein [Lentisphaerae bacterium ADurb.Bin242]|nr:MAG: Beta-galactosidase trimerization domain protein [Lentisphaerae bacterium ADurb.Bin242]